MLATTLPDGCRSAISRARLGPVTTATRSGSMSATCSMISLTRSPDPSSIPLARLTMTASVGIVHVSRFARRVCEGTAITTNSAPSMAACGSVFATIESGSSMSGK